jgi:acyl carrier protein
MTEDIMNVLSEFIARDILKQPSRRINPQDKLISSGLIDSFHLVDLALFIEDNFGVHIDDAELNASVFDTLDELVALVNERKA